jgi:large subunit ribosomal protein L9
MDIILLERIEKLGQMGDVVKVKGGFARNYLLPQKKAMRATKANIAFFETQRQHLEADNLKLRDEAQQVANKLDGLKIVVIRSAGESGQLYGSVNARDIATGVTEAGFTIQRNQVVLERPVKALGLFDLRVRLHPEVTATITANVARSEDEAAEQQRLGRAIVSTDVEEAENEAARVEALADAEAIFEPEALENAATELGNADDPSPTGQPDPDSENK